MLGELLGQGRGKVVAYRVLCVDNGAATVEVSFRGEGSIAGAEYREMGTYSSAPLPGGFLYGSGQGVLMSKAGGQATWTGNGIGKFKPAGGVSWRGAIYYQSATNDLARLNGVVGVFEYETDADDNTTETVWEWK
jgi:hypothetical protein